MSVRPSARGWVVGMKETGESTPWSVLYALSFVPRECKTWKGFRKLIQLVEWKWMGAGRWGRNGTGRPLCLFRSLRSEVMMAWIKTRKCQRKGHKYLDFCDIKIINLQTLFYPQEKISDLFRTLDFISSFKAHFKKNIPLDLFHSASIYGAPVTSSKPDTLKLFRCWHYCQFKVFKIHTFAFFRDITKSVFALVYSISVCSEFILVWV